MDLLELQLRKGENVVAISSNYIETNVPSNANRLAGSMALIYRDSSEMGGDY